MKAADLVRLQNLQQRLWPVPVILDALRNDSPDGSASAQSLTAINSNISACSDNGYSARA